MKEILNTKNAPSAIGPYSQCVVNKGIAFVSGQLPVNPEDNTIPEGVTEQAKQSLSNVKAILESGGYSLDDVVKTTVYLKDMNEFGAMNEVYGNFFSAPYPARVAVEVARLPKDVRVEIEAIAIK
ncbi:RidA family protein [Neobacillus sp. WH10]|uniref:RidA family protein n=1 Tax=Neobacillus sp. WH10 TaxID=3047873 RepID=UPI0024C1F0E9|nr:RidA family protein [Neobacillus sp. WH10]WHY78007.1 RidA family protein [Neobacillus sp. WH10]